MPVRRAFSGSWVLLLFAFWVAVSGSLNLQQLLAGAGAVLLVAWFNRDLLLPAPGKAGRMVWLIPYTSLLLLDIVKANFQVAWIVLHPRLPITPCMVKVETPLESDTGRTILANSITMTPGTLTVLAGEREFLVHALTVESGAAVQKWPPAGLLRRLEEGS